MAASRSEFSRLPNERWHSREPELVKQTELIKTPPAFDDLVVSDSEDVDTAQNDLASGGVLTHDRAAVSAAREEALHNEVALSNELVDLAPPVGKGTAKQLTHLSHAVRPVGGTGQRWIVVDEGRVEVAVDRTQITVGEQPGNESVDDLLVRFASCHVHQRGYLASRGTIPPKWECFRLISRRTMLAWVNRRPWLGAKVI